MPFTGSHPAAVLPLLLPRRSGRWLAPTGLVMGSMVPDVVLFAPRGQLSSGRSAELYHLAHSWTGLVTVDLVFGLVAVVLWHHLVGPAALAALPVAIRRHLPWRRPEPVGQLLGSVAGWAGMVSSLVLGAASHMVWDSFTHQGRWGALRIGWLSAHHAGQPGAWWAQMGSTVVGCAALVITAVVLVARHRSTHDPGAGSVADEPVPLDPAPLPPAVALVALVSLAVPTGLAAVAGAWQAAGRPSLGVVAGVVTNGGMPTSLSMLVRSITSGRILESAVVVTRAVTSAGAVAAAAVLGLAAAWRLWVADRTPAEPGRG